MYICATSRSPDRVITSGYGGDDYLLGVTVHGRYADFTQIDCVGAISKFWKITKEIEK
jgi:hypothetical protein